MWNCSSISLLVLTAFLEATNSFATHSYFTLSNLCSLELEIAQMCRHISYPEKTQSILCPQNRFLVGNYEIECTTILKKAEETILILNQEGISYYCGLNLAKVSNPSPENISSYILEYFYCDWLSKIEHLNLPRDLSYEDNTDRRTQSSCNISLNLYSSPLPSTTYIMHVANSCRLDSSWLCKDTDKANVIDKNYDILFIQAGSNSYLTAEYDVGLNKDSYTIEAISLHKGGVRRECWGNKLFEGAPITSEFANILIIASTNRVTMRYNTSTPVCRVTGYYKARYTAKATVRFDVDATANAWVLSDILQPNFPNIQHNQIYETSIDMIKDKLYYLRFDITYVNGSSDFEYFRVSYPGVSSDVVTLDDLYYPVRTDYSPLNLSSLSCNTLYFIPAPETNGDTACPVENPNCSKLSYNKNIAANMFNTLCEYYRWENSIQICEKCKSFSFIYDNVCICSEGYFYDHNTLSCVSSNVFTATIRLYKVKLI